MVWNLANALTALRVLLIPVFVGLSFLPGRWGLILAAVFFSIAAATDWADGYVARRDGLLTPFGKFFDPVADKLLVISALMLLIHNEQAHLLPVMLITAREIVVMALRELMSGLGLGGMPVSSLGKWKTGFQMTAIIMLLVQDGLFGIPFQLPGLLCLYIASILALWSGYLYFSNAWQQVSGKMLAKIM
ncbi:CDP-diacylglycerol--glycerol-3-phosphate 3-phosphatidyltransferase [Magnetococcales bacterium HHB-1]